MIDSDRSANIENWSRNFSSTGYWLGESHLEVLSRLYNVKLEIYYLDRDKGIFVKHPTFGEVNLVANTNTAPLVSLASVSIGEEGTTFNHFDGIIIDPTKEQLNEIESISSITVQPEKSVLLYVKEVAYDNPLLNQDKLVKASYELVGIESLDILRDLGTDSGVVEGIIQATRELGHKKVAEIFFSQPEAKQEKTEYPQIIPSLRLNWTNEF